MTATPIFDCTKAALQAVIDVAKACDADRVLLEVRDGHLWATANDKGTMVGQARVLATIHSPDELGLNLGHNRTYLSLQEALKPLVASEPVAVLRDGGRILLQQGRRRMSLSEIRRDYLEAVKMPDFSGKPWANPYACVATLEGLGDATAFFKAAEGVKDDALLLSVEDGTMRLEVANGADNVAFDIPCKAGGGASGKYNARHFARAFAAIEAPATLKFTRDQPLTLESPTATFLFAPWIDAE